VHTSSHVTYANINISAVSTSSAFIANTDGWDIYRSSQIYIHDCTIVNDDDCVSFKPNTTYATVENLFCNGSHGISVGSLGQYYGETDIVANVYVNNITLVNTEYGARIKVFGGSNDTNSISGGGSGYVNNITFENMVVQNTDTPIYLTQCYEGTTTQCTEHPATLQISDVHYINISGTASGKTPNGTVVELECSAECVNITATGIDLVAANGTKPQYLCANIADENLLDFTCTNVNVTAG